MNKLIPFSLVNPFKPDLNIPIFMRCMSKIATAILDCSGWRWRKMGCKRRKILVLLKQFHENYHCKPPGSRKLGHLQRYANNALMHREGLEVNNKITWSCPFLAHPVFRPKMSLCYRMSSLVSVVCCLSSVHNASPPSILIRFQFCFVCLKEFVPVQ